MNFYDRHSCKHDTDKRIKDLKREIKSLTKQRSKQVGHALAYDINDITSSIKDTGRQMYNKLTGHSSLSNYIGRGHHKRRSKIATLLLGLGVALTTIKAVKHHRCSSY